MLSKNRDMTLNEVKLILAIEDPRAQEARRVYGVEVSVLIKRPSGGGKCDVCVYSACCDDKLVPSNSESIVCGFHFSLV